MTKKRPSKKHLEQLYFKKNKSLACIANTYKVVPSTVCRWFKDLGIKARRLNKLIDLKGKRFGKLTAKDYFFKKENLYWNCQCDCGKMVEISKQRLLRGFTKGCLDCDIKKSSDSHRWTGIEDVPGTIFCRCKNNAKIRNLEMSLSKERLVEILNEQNRECALTGDKLWFNNRETNASIDRIDSSKGYIEGNVQWTTKEINLLKSNWHDKDFIELCRKIVNKQDNKEK